MTGRPAKPKAQRKTRDGVPVAAFDPALVATPGSLHDLISRYVDFLEIRNYSPTTIEDRRGILLLWASFCTERGLILVADITRHHLERYQAHLYRVRTAAGKALSVRTQKGKLTVVRLFFSWAVKHYFIPANPAADLEMPRPVHVLPVYLTQDEVRRILAVPDIETPEGLRDRAMLECFYSTGIRRSEMARLSVDDVDVSAGLLRVNQGKGNKDRLIPIGDRALAWIDRYETEARFAWLHDAKIRFLFLQPDGYGMTVSQVAARVGRCLRAAEITKPGCCHLFRHTFATQLLNAGCDMRYIKDMMGHAKMDTTALYAQVAVGRLKDMHRTFHPAENPQAADAAS